MRKLESALVVAADPSQRRRLGAFLEERWRIRARQAHDLAEALGHLQAHPDLVLFHLPIAGDAALRFAEVAARQCPAPVQVALGSEISAEEAFRLAQTGVRAVVSGRLSSARLTRGILQALEDEPPLEPFLKGAVGHRSLREVQAEVRRVMVNEAMGLTGGSRGASGRLLRVSRQAIQQALRTFAASGHAEPEPGPGQRLAG